MTEYETPKLEDAIAQHIHPLIFPKIADKMEWERSLPEGELDPDKKYGLVTIGSILPVETKHSRWNLVEFIANFWMAETVTAVNQENAKAMSSGVRLGNVLKEVEQAIAQEEQSHPFHGLQLLSPESMTMFSVSVGKPHLFKIETTGDFRITLLAYRENTILYPHKPKPRISYYEPPIQFYRADG